MFTFCLSALIDLSIVLRTVIGRIYFDWNLIEKSLGFTFGNRISFFFVKSNLRVSKFQLKLSTSLTRYAEIDSIPYLKYEYVE